MQFSKHTYTYTIVTDSSASSVIRYKSKSTYSSIETDTKLRLVAFHHLHLLVTSRVQQTINTD